MKLTKDIIVASRYQLAECLGAGAMGEVWRAQDTRFESRLVAVKFLREDETLKEDALNRDRLMIRLEQQAARGGLTLQIVLEAIAAALGAASLENLRAKAEATLGSSPAIKPADVITVFDELVNDPTFNDNARMRAKLRRLFRDEANAVANLRHDNIVSIFDYGDHEGSPYLVMDYIEGRTLYQVIQSSESLSRSRQLQLIEDLCAGLGYAHRHKLVHRDIKPANLIIDGSTGSLKILDFGVVRRLGSASTVGVPVGTFCYMSPEQTRGAATLDHRSDIFAVGLVFYELMSGKKAFPPGKSIGDLVARIQRDPPPSLLELVPSLPKAIDEIIGKALQKQPEGRYQELAVMERELGRVRAKLEAAEQAEGTSVTNVVADQTIIKTRAPQTSVADRLANAERLLEAGDEKGALEICNKILATQPASAPTLGLVGRIESRQKEARVRDVIQQAEKQLAVEELTTARASLARAREIDPFSAAVKSVEAKLDAAFAARAVARERLERDQREREQQGDRERREQEQRAQREREARDQELRAQREREAREQELRAQREAALRKAPPPEEQTAITAPPPPRGTSRPPQSQPPSPPPLDATLVQPQVRSRIGTPGAPPPSQGPATSTKSGGPSRKSKTAIPPTGPPAPAVTAAKVPPPGAPRTVARSGVNPKTLAIGGGIAAALVLIIVVGAVVATRRAAPPPQAVTPPPAATPAPVVAATEPAPAPVNTEPPPVEAPPPPSMTTVLIDVRPWARVKIVPEVANPAIPADALFAPFSIDLPPGNYNLECENGGLNKNVTLPLTVAAGGPERQTFVRTMPGFNPTKTVESLLGQND